MFPIRHSTKSRLLRQRKRFRLMKGRAAPYSNPVFDRPTQGRSFLARTKPDVMQKLRERGIYALSDGREFVVHAVFRGGYVFYTPEEWEIFGPHAFESDADGNLCWGGQTNHWSTEDLIDTSRTAQSRSRNYV